MVVVEAVELLGVVAEDEVAFAEEVEDTVVDTEEVVGVAIIRTTNSKEVRLWCLLHVCLSRNRCLSSC